MFLIPQPRHRYTVSAASISALLAIASIMPVCHAAPIDEFRISDIEQRVRNLESAVRDQSRQLNQIQPISGSRNTAPAPASAVTEQSLRWVNAASWSRIKPGMSELQVVEILGAPTQMRIADDNQSRQLLYALEIGRSGYLSGRVSCSNGVVTAVETPTLK